jgi:hypothetical protein
VALTTTVVTNPAHGFPVVRAADLPVNDEREPWLIDGLWRAQAAGVLGGAPKCCKSWLALDMAVSVSTGTPCLGRFDVTDRGPALIFMAEDALVSVRDRLDAIARSRGLRLHQLDVHVITADTMRLDREADRVRLAETTERIAPRLLVLDPLVRLHQVDENNATAIAELLSYLRGLQRRFALALLIVHHARKNGGAQGGVGLRGSSDIWAFGDSNLYLRSDRGDVLRLTMEHRTAAAPEPVALRLVASSPDGVHLEVVGETGAANGVEEIGPTLDHRVLDILRHRDKVNREDLRRELRVRNERLGGALARLVDERRVLRDPDGVYRLAEALPAVHSHSAPLDKDGTGTR